MPTNIQIKDNEWDEIQKILFRLVPQREVWVFGSRIRLNAKPFSDLDLAFPGEIPLSIEESANLKEAFSESDLPFKVDLLDLATADVNMVDIVKQNYQIIKHSV